MRVGILGGGELGWGFGQAAARNGHDVIVWSRRPQRASTETILVTSELARVAETELLFFAIPSPFVVAVAESLGMYLDGSHFLVHVNRGIVDDELQTISQILRHKTPCRRIGVLAGPLGSETLRAAMPGAAIVGTRFPEVKQAVQQALAGSYLRIDGLDDVIGIEFTSVMVGILSLAIGYGQQSGLSPITLAMMILRGIDECKRLVVELGGQEQAFDGMGGYGDLMAALANDGRPELAAGAYIARGLDVGQISAQLHTHIEGIHAIRSIAKFIECKKLQVPLLQALGEIFTGVANQEKLLSVLMNE